MEQRNYRFLAQIISDTYYKGKTSDDANFSLPYFAELIAMEVAEQATIDAYSQSNQGESTYANDQFISVYKNQPILEEGGEKYAIIPATPAGLPKNREISSVSITGSKCLECIPIRNHASFSQSLIGMPKGIIMYKIEDGKIVFETLNPLLKGTVTFKLVGAISKDSLLDSPLNVPKNIQSRIAINILNRLLPLKNIPQDLINDSISNPA